MLSQTTAGQPPAGRPRPAQSGIVNSPLLLALVVFLLALAPRLADLGVFVGPDESSWVKRSDNFARALADGDLAATYQSGHPGVTLLWLELPVSWGQRDAGATANQLVQSDDEEDAPSARMSELVSKRRVVAVFHALVVALAVLMVRALFGPGVAWIAGFLLALDPFLLTESRAVRSEGIVTSFGLLAILSLLLFLTAQRLRYAVLVGGLTGLALLSKVSAVALLPSVALAAVTRPLLFRLPGVSRDRPQVLLALGILAGTALLAVVLLWPALWVAPVAVARQMIDYVGLRAVEGGGGGSYSFFMGRSLPGKELGPAFYPVVLLYRTGPWQWLGLILLAGFAWRARDWTRRTTVSVMIATSFLAGYLALITLAGLKFDRYTVPMLPAIDLLAALGLVMTWRRVAEGRPAARWLGSAAALVVLVVQVALAVPHHPYYYTYYNPLLGGIHQAAQVVPVGTGYEGTEQAAAYLNGLPAPEQIRLATAVSSKIKPLFTGQTIPMDNQDGHWFLADYTFIYISQLQRGKHDDELITYLRRKPLAHAFQLAGLDYGWIYRGPGAQFYGGDTKLEGRAILHAFDLSAGPITSGQTLTATVYFRNDGQRAGDRFYVRLADPDGYVWADGTVQPRSDFEVAFDTRKAIVEGAALLSLPIGMPPGTYTLKMGFEDATTNQPIGEFVLPAENDDVVVTLPAELPAAAAFQPPHAVEMIAPGDLQLLGYDLAEHEFAAGQAVWLTLYWQALRDVRRDYVIGVQLLDSAGAEVAYWLGRPAMNRYPTPEWQAHQVVQDAWRLVLPAEAAPGDYTLQVSAYDAATGDRLATTKLATLSITSVTVQ